MVFWERIKTGLHHRKLHKEMRKQHPVQRQSTHFDRADKIGILFDASDKEQDRLVMRYVDRLRRKHQKRVSLLGCFHDKEERDVALFKHYSLKDVNWTQVPDNEDVRTFMQRDFDIAINFIAQPSLHHDYIMALSHAHLRVGRNSSNTEAYDLIINDAQNDPAHFIGLVDMYLRIFNPEAKPNAARPQAV